MSNKNEQNKIDDLNISTFEKALFNTISNTKLSDDEKEEGLNTLRDFMNTNSVITSPYQFKITSPYFKEIFTQSFVFVQKQRLVSAIVLIAIIFTGITGTAYAAQDALPGDLLYPIKINVNEQLEEALAKDTTEKAKIALKHSITRLREIETLTKQGKITEKAKEEVSRNFETQSKLVQSNIEKLKTEGNTDTAIRISSDFEDQLKKYSKEIKKSDDDTAVKERTILTTDIQHKIDDSVSKSSKLRLDLEDNLPTLNNISLSKKKAFGEMKSSEQKLSDATEKIQVLDIIKVSSAEKTAKITDGLNKARKALDEGKQRIEVGAYNNAIPLFKNVQEHSDKIDAEIKSFFVSEDNELKFKDDADNN